jgi:AcrR family transcriptional regulator
VTAGPDRGRADEAGATALLPEGTEPPAGVPADIFAAALATFLGMRRLDMRSLAKELGMGRATLYRRIGSRDELLGEVLWFLTRRSLVHAVRAAEGLTGTARILHVCATFMQTANAQESLRRFLSQEPEAALRILTSKAGAVQPGVVGHTARLLQQEVDGGRFKPRLPVPTLAFVIVRIGEGFLYADVIADGEPDVTQAIEVIQQLLEGWR